jgi:hypothetical protein
MKIVSTVDVAMLANSCGEERNILLKPSWPRPSHIFANTDIARSCVMAYPRCRLFSTTPAKSVRNNIHAAKEAAESTEAYRSGKFYETFHFIVTNSWAR